MTFIMKVALGVLGTGGVALAGPLNGGFETGDFTDWGTSGAVSPGFSDVVMSEFGRNLGGGTEFWYPTEGTHFASLWSFGEDVTGTTHSYTEISQTFTAGIDEKLIFDYFVDFGDFVDFSEATATAQLSWAGGANSATLVDVFGPDLGDFGETGWNTVSYNLQAGVEYTLIFRIEDALGGEFESLFGIDDVRVGPSTVIPLPTGMGMAGVAVGALGLRGRRRGL